MKKIITIVFVVSILLGCSSSDSDNSNSSDGCLNPPSWLIGSWVHYYTNGTESYISNKIVVTNNDVVYYDYQYDGNLAGAPLSVKDSFCENNFYVVSQESNNQFYMWKYTFGESISYNYFYKLSNTSFSYDNFASGADPNGFIYVKL
jgi:hypothetical protein